MNKKALTLIIAGTVFLFIPLPPIATIIGLTLILTGLVISIK